MSLWVNFAEQERLGYKRFSEQQNHEFQAQTLLIQGFFFSCSCNQSEQSG